MKHLWIKCLETQQQLCHPLPTFLSLAWITEAEEDVGEPGGGQE